jgi:ribosome-binding factor A
MYRVEKAAAAVREVVSMAILTEIKDPRVRDVTVTRVEMTLDMRQAKVYVSIMGDETKQKLSLSGLKNAAGFLQSKVAKRIDTRYTPRLEFLLDMGVKKSIEIAEILGRVLPKEQDSMLDTELDDPMDDDATDDDATDDDATDDDATDDGGRSMKDGE